MDNSQIICMIIAYAGDSKSCFLEAMEAARTGDFKSAEELMAKGSESLLKAHTEHTNLVTSEARGEGVEISLLLIHASSMFSDADIAKYYAEQFIELCKEVKK